MSSRGLWGRPWAGVPRLTGVPGLTGATGDASSVAPGPSDRRPSSGFTLLELLIVLAIVALVVGVSAPWIQKIARRNKFRSAASEIQSTLLATRMRAVRLNGTASMVVHPAAPTESMHLLQTVELDPPSPTPTPNPTRTLPLSTDALAFLTLPVNSKVSFDGNGRRVAPAGALSSDIVVEGPTGAGDRNQITIRTSMTGRVEVITPAVWQ